MMKNAAFWAGVDYGAKFRASTAITFLKKKTITTVLSPKKTDVDLWLEDFLQKEGIHVVFMDAPLSLPKIYFDPLDQESSHHFRQVDRELGAMSPLFLGGLTARAMAFKQKIEKRGATVLETYPSAILRKRFSEKTLDEALLLIASEVEFAFPSIDGMNPHEKDSILAWYAGYRYHKKESMIFGRKEEGQIFL
ncbi:MAG: hypothetical protein AAGI90_06995 [Chlamydiota bacterium]